ncbi:uncharacterized protein LOC103994485 isoform X2 [Musa acuminata AAA Group]|uniref:uncharacterized protein LOC103994485 isoform X2 n=1 Tax=Musa acuminata AAA Group TaxID=214697 RepID=UPI0031D4C089
MGSVISKAANGVGTALGNAFVAPVKTIFGASCEGICSGTWDITCFIEHLCISNLLRLLMVSVLAYIKVSVRCHGQHVRHTGPHSKRLPVFCGTS